MKSLNLTLILTLIVTSLSGQDQGFSSHKLFDDAFSSPVVTQLNNDSLPDLLFLERDVWFADRTYVVHTLLNQADSLLGFAHSEFESPVALENHILTMDADQDGDLDLVSTQDETGNLVFFIQQPDASYRDSILTLAGLPNLMPVDIDNDGKTDLLGFSETDYKITVYYNEGDFNFTPYSPLSELRVSSVDIVDVDDDGDLDIAVSVFGYFDESIFLLVNQGDRTFASQVINDDSFQQIDEVRFADLDGSGKKDIAAMNYTGISFWMHQGGTTYSRRSQPFPVSGPLQSLEIADFNGDGYADFTLGDYGGTGVTLYLNQVTDPMTVSSSVISRVRPAYSQQAIDLDLDGDLDLIVDNGDLWIVENEIEQVSTSVSELSDRQVLVYPNPTSGLLIVEMENTMTGSCRVVDVQGRKVKDLKVDKQKEIILDLAKVPPGIYLVLFQGENGRIWRRYITRI